MAVEEGWCQVDYTRVKVTLTCPGREPLVRVIANKELPAYLATATAVGWVCVEVEWTMDELSF